METVRYQGRDVGVLAWQKQGSGARVEVSCEVPEAQGFLRCWAKTENGWFLIGLLSPEGGRLVLQRTLSGEACKQMGVTRQIPDTFVLSETQPEDEAAQTTMAVAPEPTSAPIPAPETPAPETPAPSPAPISALEASEPTPAPIPAPETPEPTPAPIPASETETPASTPAPIPAPDLPAPLIPAPVDPAPDIPAPELPSPGAPDSNQGVPELPVPQPREIPPMPGSEILAQGERLPEYVQTRPALPRTGDSLLDSLIADRALEIACTEEADAIVCTCEFAKDKAFALAPLFGLCTIENGRAVLRWNKQGAEQ